jgi:hypothetical protein
MPYTNYCTICGSGLLPVTVIKCECGEENIVGSGGDYCGNCGKKKVKEIKKKKVKEEKEINIKIVEMEK